MRNADGGLSRRQSTTSPSSGFQEFLSKYPNDPRAADAQLSRGEAFFNQKKFDQAVVEYDVFLQKYPENDKTRTALYKKGLALAEQNQKQPALDALDKVVKKFPNTSEATNAPAKVRELRGCTARPALGKGRTQEPYGKVR